MVPASPAEALGAHTHALRATLVDVVRHRHDLAADGHLATGSRYGMGFGSQWRDLMDDAREAVTKYGFPTCKLMPGGISVPIVNNCVVYVWRIPAGPNAVRNFASSPTRQGGFDTQLPQGMLFEPMFPDSVIDDPADESDELARVVKEVSTDAMPVILVMVDSSPRLLQSISWAIATLDEEGKVELKGEETIWQAELVDAQVGATQVEPFDSGAPAVPVVEVQEQERPHPDA